MQGKTEEQIKAEKAWYNTEKVWLVHKDGFSMGENKLPYLNLCIKGLFLDICKVNSQLSILSVLLCLFSGRQFFGLFKYSSAQSGENTFDAKFEGESTCLDYLIYPGD